MYLLDIRPESEAWIIFFINLFYLVIFTDDLKKWNFAFIFMFRGFSNVNRRWFIYLWESHAFSKVTSFFVVKRMIVMLQVIVLENSQAFPICCFLYNDGVHIFCFSYYYVQTGA